VSLFVHVTFLWLSLVFFSPFSYFVCHFSDFSRGGNEYGVLRLIKLQEMCWAPA
jgi:hypothetical protein